MRVCFCVSMCLLIGLLSAFPSLADSVASSEVQVATGVELSVSAGLKQLHLPRYAGGDTVLGNALNTIDFTRTSYSGTIDGNAVAMAVRVDTPFAVPGFRTTHFISAFEYSGGTHRQTEIQAVPLGAYIMCLSVDPRYNWIGTVGTNFAANYEQSVKIAEHDYNYSLGIEGAGNSLVLSDAVSVTPVAYMGLLVQEQHSRIWTDIVRIATREFTTLDEQLRSTLWGPQVKAGARFALPGNVDATLMGHLARLHGTCALQADQRVYFNNALAGAGTTRPAYPYVSHHVDDTYSSVVYGASLKVEKPVYDALLLGLELSATHWSSRPSIVNPIAIGSSPNTPSFNPGVRIRYDDADELGAMLRLTYAF